MHPPGTDRTQNGTCKDLGGKVQAQAQATPRHQAGQRQCRADDWQHPGTQPYADRKRECDAGMGTGKSGSGRAMEPCGTDSQGEWPLEGDGVLDQTARDPGHQKRDQNGQQVSALPRIHEECGAQHAREHGLGKFCGQCARERGYPCRRCGGGIENQEQGSVDLAHRCCRDSESLQCVGLSCRSRDKPGDRPHQGRMRPEAPNQRRTGLYSSSR